MGDCLTSHFSAIGSRSAEPDFTPIGEFTSRASAKSNTRTLADLVFKENCVLEVTHFAGAVDDNLFDFPFYFSAFTAKKTH